MELTTKQGFKQTEVGLIPEDWNEIKLGKNAMMFSGGTPNTAVKEYYKGDIPWISSSELNQKNIYSTNRFISENGLNNSSAKLVFENTFLLAMYGATAGICAITKIKGAINQAVLAIESERITSSYLYHFFSLKKEEIILKYCQGGQPNLSGSIVKSIKIPLPPTLKEQKAIATALSDVDNLITSLENLIAKKQAIKQGAMQQLLTPPHKGGKRLSGFSGEWVEKELGELGQFKNGVNKGAEDFGHGKPFINLLDVFGIPSISSDKSLGLINSTPEERKIYDLKKGDVLFVRSSVKPSGVGLTTVIIDDLINSVFSGFLIRFRDNNTLNLTFKIHCFHSKEFRDKVISSSSSSANTNINQEALSSLTIWYPPTDSEQKAIAKILSDMDAELEQLETKKAKYQQLKQGMLQELLTGNTRLV
ncbi:Type I restriction-modification enzyme S subunit, HsdS family [Tenacibaculum maritimum]|uniref:restriction endonuclease subunit S n=1 Tax=Tenacibaculum maritimum TaxID=107401 RepID=UPI0012E494DF|nr:restriction endonuclease subunit S [Tenacibaculum maritimum]CAA0226807.1 Type I restriction-modification enzyme S subunit, HsdS family [Tenacibaculum maritimum]